VAGEVLLPQAIVIILKRTLGLYCLGGGISEELMPERLVVTMLNGLTSFVGIDSVVTA